jgi:hypothetical protein
MEGAHEVVLIGVPRDQYGELEVAAASEALVSRDEAIATAKSEARIANDSPVRQAVLGRYTDQTYNESVRGRLVWLINFAHPDEVSRGAGSCDGSAICNCYWSYHAGYVFSAIDANTGEWLFQAEGGGNLDPSRAPREGYPPVTEDERERCRNIIEEGHKAARSN